MRPQMQSNARLDSTLFIYANKGQPFARGLSEKKIGFLSYDVAISERGFTARRLVISPEAGLCRDKTCPVMFQRGVGEGEI